MTQADRPSADIIIRRAAPDDAADLAALAAQTFADAFGPDNRPEDTAAHLEGRFSPARQAAEIADPSTVMLVADAGGALVGYVMLLIGEAPPSVTGARPIELARIYVRQEWQSRRVGAALMAQCLTEARAAGAHTIWLGVWQVNVRAQAFYERWGFQIVGTKAFTVGSDVQTDWVMSRRLGSD
jgi:ribosomal protein S18 acetylase RimI-like enzyme